MKPPSVLEILIFPLLGIIGCHFLITRQNELVFFFMPFLFVGFRLGMAQLKAPRASQFAPGSEFERARERYISFEHLASFTILLLEAGSVITSNPTTPAELWWIVAGLYAIYVMLRMKARQYWILAQERPPGPNEGLT